MELHKHSKYLLVGDVHATVDDLDDCWMLIECIKANLKSSSEFDIGRGRPEHLVFLGDQTHNHAIVNVHVLNFWKEALLELRKYVNNIVLLVGNHDGPGNIGRRDIHSMSTLDHLAVVVEDYMVFEDFLFIAHQPDNKKFIDICQKHSDMKTVVCHQTFQGASYDNGFMATDGVEFSDLPEEQKYISGHIHTPSQFGRVTYIGAPRYRTVADAGPDRSIVSFNSLGEITEHCPTHMFVRRIFVKDVECGPKSMPIFMTLGSKNKDVHYCNLTGPSKDVDRLAISAGTWSNVRKFYTDTKPVTVRESEGIDKALLRYLESSTTITPRDALKRLVEERIWKKIL